MQFTNLELTDRPVYKLQVCKAVSIEFSLSKYIHSKQISRSNEKRIHIVICKWMYIVCHFNRRNGFWGWGWQYSKATFQIVKVLAICPQKFSITSLPHTFTSFLLHAPPPDPILACKLQNRYLITNLWFQPIIPVVRRG